MLVESRPRYSSGNLQLGADLVAAAIGSVSAYGGARRVKMTAMPQMVACSTGFAGSAALIALAEFHELEGVLVWDEALSVALSALIGSISFSGSLSRSRSSRSSSRATIVFTAKTS